MRRLEYNPAKWGYLKYVLGMAVPAILVAIMILVDYADTAIIRVNGAILGEQDNWSAKHGNRCLFI